MRFTYGQCSLLIGVPRSSWKPAITCRLGRREGLALHSGIQQDARARVCSLEHQRPQQTTRSQTYGFLQQFDDPTLRRGYFYYVPSFSRRVYCSLGRSRRCCTLFNGGCCIPLSGICGWSSACSQATDESHASRDCQIACRHP